MTPEEHTFMQSKTYSIIRSLEWGQISDDFYTLQRLLYEWHKAQGFWPERLDQANVGEKIALMHSELSEALEADRHNATDDKIPSRSGLEVELADCLIRILDFCGAYQLDLAGALRDKIEYNLNRPYRHGKQY